MQEEQALAMLPVGERAMILESAGLVLCIWLHQVFLTGLNFRGGVMAEKLTLALTAVQR